MSSNLGHHVPIGRYHLLERVDDDLAPVVRPEPALLRQLVVHTSAEESLQHREHCLWQELFGLLRS